MYYNQELFKVNIHQFIDYLMSHIFVNVLDLYELYAEILIQNEECLSIHSIMFGIATLLVSLN